MSTTVNAIDSGLASLGFDQSSINIASDPVTAALIDPSVISGISVPSDLSTSISSDLASLTNSISGIGLKKPLTTIGGTNLYATSPTQIGAIDQTSGTGLQGTVPSLSSSDPLSSNFNFDLSGTTPGIDSSTGTGFGSIASIAGRGPNIDVMGGGQGLTSYIPPQYNADGSVVSGTGGTLTAAGFIPDNATAGHPTISLGNPLSPINNPNITGNSAVVTNNQIATPTGQFGVSPTITTIDKNGNVTTTPGGSSTGPGTQNQGNSNLSSLLPLLAAAGLLNKGGGSSTAAGQSNVIPNLTASRPAIAYTPPQAGQNNVRYFSDVTYAAGGGQMHGGISTLGSYSDGGHLLKGPGDGVSDSIPATIGGHQPARLADGEFVIPARIVSELGNGSTDAGARKLYAMMDRIKKARSKAKDIAADTKADKHLPA